MYTIDCKTCGSVGFHPSRIGAESRAERHTEQTGHRSDVNVME